MSQLHSRSLEQQTRSMVSLKARKNYESPDLPKYLRGSRQPSFGKKA